MSSFALEQIKTLISSSQPFEELASKLSAGENLTVKNAAGSLAAVLISILQEHSNAPFLCVLPFSDQAELMRDELAGLASTGSATGVSASSTSTSSAAVTSTGSTSASSTSTGSVTVTAAGGGDAIYFPATKMLPWGHPDPQALSLQVEAIEHLVEYNSKKEFGKARPPVVLTTAKAVLETLLSPQALHAKKIELRLGDELPFETLITQLIEMGFERQPVVEQPGELAVRGGIIDLFPLSRTLPVRIEFWGDRVESLREFDPTTQRSESEISKVILLPQNIVALAEEGKNGKESSTSKKAPTQTLLNYFPENTIVCFFRPDQILAALNDGKVESSTDDGDWLESDVANDLDEQSWQAFAGRFQKFRQLTFAQFHHDSEDDLIDLHAIPQPSLHGDLKALRLDLESFKEKSQSPDPPKIFFVCESPTHAERIGELLEESELAAYRLHVLTGPIHGGFSLPQQNLVVYTDHEFYGRVRRIRKRRKQRTGLTFRQLKSLKRGDYIVHVDHGIGVYQGLEHIKIGENEQECIVIHYLDKDKLYVPLDKMDRVQKYTARESAAPKLHKLGSTDWEKLKARTKKRIKDIARDLIQLYAAREAEKGYAFSADTIWQRDLEASFEYEDTPDQARAVEEVKRDMEGEKPMDRLVCGDVGYGKTEVAIRAAFKAVQDSKQVAVLVPTTLLAQQHYNTFSSRLQRYPVRVDVLSRFRSSAEQKRIAERLKQGEVDIIIGTHRLLSKDIAFKDLGLLIVDEEQRFGVRHKELLKKLKVNVDVLTLSATPIPRTLHMALTGVRDMSNINTPPRDRLPIHTEVAQLDRDLVRTAIMREIHRGGQVFVVHNRISSIHRIAGLIRALVPEVEIGVAHGRMNEHELEEVMVNFVRRDYHVLVATMIIESGLDMPNVNTMIINRADRFGLAQLYQLRGRVGRSHHKAYCYLVVPPIRNLSNEAIKRLETIEEFTDLGSGFQIAMRDLEIRGAGNLLGAEQSGMIDAVGFDLYTRILDEAVREARHEAQPESVEPFVEKEQCRVDLDGDAFLPADYVDLPEERVAIYRRLAEADSLAEIEAISDELTDRFGKLPLPARNLLGLASLKLLGTALGLKSLRVLARESRAKFSDAVQRESGKSFEEWVDGMMRRAPYPIEFFQNGGLGFKMEIPKGQAAMPMTVKLLMGMQRDWK
ncbi:transcription-repair coupling factor [candidate division KSB1 bacterium]|nr:MAG: transcription-repair coupling factor [candidate division KSB1 bacterium]MBC6946890.1 transcription-repair coupling factor [candidate division KSB1 bacterium]MCE7941314.1 transcription-repair coupling factor [Chlorobi bacterium CHB1]